MLHSVETFAFLVIFVIDVPALNGRNVVTHDSKPILGSERVVLTEEGKPPNEKQRWQGPSHEDLTQTNNEGTQADMDESQLTANLLRTKGIESKYPVHNKKTKKQRLLNKVEKNEIKLEDQFLIKAKEDQENNLAAKLTTYVRKSQKARLDNPAHVVMRDYQRTDFKNSVPSLQKREPFKRQPSVTNKSRKDRQGSSESKPNTSAKLKETLARTLSKAKQIVNLPQSIARSFSSPKQGMKRNNSPNAELSNSLTSGHVRKPSGLRQSSSEKTKAFEHMSFGPPRWIPSDNQPEIPKKSSPSPPRSSPDNTQQMWDFIHRNSKRNSNTWPTENPNQGVRPPSPPKSRSPEKQSREAGKTDSESEEKKRINGFINWSRGVRGMDLESAGSNEGLHQQPANAPSSRILQPSRKSHSSSSSSAPSPKTTTGDPTPQLRRKLSTKEINDQYNEISNKLKTKKL